MANVEQIKGYVGPPPPDPKKDVIVDKKRFQEELNKKVQAGTEADKQEQQKKKHLAKAAKDDEEDTVIHEVVLPQVQDAFAAFMEDDTGASVDGVKQTRVVSSSGLGAPTPLGDLEDLSHIEEDIISTAKNVYTDTPPQAPVQTPQAPTSAPAPVQTQAPAPAPPPPQPQEAPAAPAPVMVTVPLPDEDNLLVAPPPEEDFTPTPQTIPDAPVTTVTSSTPQKAKKEEAPAILPGHELKKSLREKRFQKRLEQAKAHDHAAPKESSPVKQGGPPPPTPVPPPPAAPVVQGAIPPPPSPISIKQGKEGSKTTGAVHGVSALRTTIRAGRSRSEKEKQEQEEEKAAAQNVAATTGQVPFKEVAIVQKTAPTPYSTLSPQVRELFDKMVGMITVQSQTGVTTTTVSINLPGSPLQGVQVILQQFDTARHSFNIQLEGTPEQLNLLNANVNDLAAAFAGGKYAFSVNILTPQLLTKSPHLIHRKESAGEKKENPNK